MPLAKVLGRLAQRRPVFHNETDFQHALAWELHLEVPNAFVRLELTPFGWQPGNYLDLMVNSDGGGLAIETKYKTRRLKIEIGGEAFVLKDHSAQPDNRYLFVRDIERLENIASAKTRIRRFAVMLTNDQSYWTQQSGRATFDDQFRLHEGRVLEGTLEWSGAVGDWVQKNRIGAPIRLKGKYELHWADYVQLQAGSNGRFRYLLVETVNN